MIRILEASTDDVLAILRQRTVHRDDETEAIVRRIVEDVHRHGDAALLKVARRFDAPEIDRLGVAEEEWSAVRAEIPASWREAMATTRDRVTAFYADQLDKLTSGTRREGRSYRWRREKEDVGQRLLPLQSVGVYVPGGGAAYPSSVFMNAIPAKVAGVEKIVVTTPARTDATLHPAVLAAADEVVGLANVFKIGGAAAIAALAFGTETVPRVDKVVGPGNRFVNEAKRQLWGQVGLDGYAGPSEVCVVADDSANAAFAAADLLTQIEHAPDNAGFLVVLGRAKLDEVLAEAERQLRGAPREATMRAALRNESLAIVARDLDEAIDFVNAIAPEHLTLAVQDPERAMEKVRNAGCILLGEYTPESAGDFCLGPSHTLPTGGAARWQSPVNVLDFLKVQSVARLSPGELEPLVRTIETFGEMEGFPTHARGASIRFEGEAS